ncbi:MAG: peptidoglycan editing factor PgeF [Bacteroidetes bacterium]|jgi:hypothetical protein|nr:peptidoglycan editing factor PgeF [Bacteroidota bacterium]
MSQVPLVLPTIFSGIPRLRAAMSTRHGGVSGAPLGMNLSLNIGDEVSAVKENRRRFLAAIGSDEAHTAFAAQCHSGTVTPVDRPGLHPSCDALLTVQRGIALAVSIADCVPILLADDRATAVAAVHAGWRGTKQRILSNVVGHLRMDLGIDPRAMRAWIGPAAGPCCYEVGPEVSALFHGDAVVQKGHRTTLDLHAENRRQLVLAGVPAEQIEVDGRCTICGADVFHSFRRDGDRSGRMLAAIIQTEGA